MYINIYIYTRYGKKTTRFPSRPPPHHKTMYLSSERTCQRSKKPKPLPDSFVDSIRQKNRSPSRGPKESFSNPIPRLITSIRTRIISHFTRGKIRFRNGWPFSLSSETCQRVIQRFIDPPPPPPPAFLQFASICDYVRAN